MTKSEELLSRIADLEQANDNLRRELLRQKKAMAGAKIMQGTGEVTTGSVLAGGAPELRNDLTEAIVEFERARHLVRLALFSLLGEDTSQAEIARSLGISRQLASRLAQEAADAHGPPGLGQEH